MRTKAALIRQIQYFPQKDEISKANVGMVEYKGECGDGRVQRFFVKNKHCRLNDSHQAFAAE